MKIGEAEQIALKNLDPNVPDIIICASGYEKRGRHLASSLKPGRHQIKIALAYTGNRCLSREENDKCFVRLGYTLHAANGDRADDVKRMLRDALLRTEAEELSIFVDYTCMTRVWYAGIITSLMNAPGRFRSITVYFGYSSPRFTKPSDAAPNLYMGPIDRFCQLGIPNRETALILGLGYERERALGLMEYVEAKETYAFYTDPALDVRFTKTVLRNNRELIARIKKAHVVKHSLTDFRATSSLLSSLCLGLSDKYRVILAPLGVKPFSLLCLLFAARFPFFDVWRVSSGAKNVPIDRAPCGPILICKATFVA